MDSGNESLGSSLLYWDDELELNLLKFSISVNKKSAAKISKLTCLSLYIFSFLFLFAPWYMLEKPGMDLSQIQFKFWTFLTNAVCALALNFSIFLVIGRTGAVTIRVAGVLKDWILIALSTVLFPESSITGLNLAGYAIGTQKNYSKFAISCSSCS